MEFLCWLPGSRMLRSWWSSVSVCRRSSPSRQRRRTGSRSSSCWRSSWSWASPDNNTLLVLVTTLTGLTCDMCDMLYPAPGPGVTLLLLSLMLGVWEVLAYLHIILCQTVESLVIYRVTSPAWCEPRSQRRIQRGRRERSPWWAPEEVQGDGRSCPG